MGQFVNKKERAGQTEFNFSFSDQRLTKEQKAERKIGSLFGLATEVDFWLRLRDFRAIRGRHRVSYGE